MLHAELHGKLNPEASNLQREEDILTSTTFGTLLIAGATDVLIDWLNCSEHLATDGLFDRENLDLAEAPAEYWFWPALEGAWPDVLLRIGRRLLVIEAKYGSKKSGTVEDDQLMREWDAAQPPAPDSYPPGICEAIAGCRIDLIYLVRGENSDSALEELRESQALILASGVTPSLWRLTWEDLYSVVKCRIAERPDGPRWREELRRLLCERRALQSLPFPEIGFPKEESLVGVRQWANRWGNGEVGSPAFSDVPLGPDFHENIVAVLAWGAAWAGQPRPSEGWSLCAALDVAGIRDVAGYLRAWSTAFGKC